jgi:hypothetical protein
MYKFLTCAIFYFSCFILSGEMVNAQTAPGAVDSVSAAIGSPAEPGDSLISDSSESLGADSDYSPVPEALYPATLRQVPERKVKAYQREPDFAYANDPAYWKKEPPPDAGWINGLFKLLYSGLFRTLLLILLLLIISYAVYRLARENSFSWFRRSNKRLPGQDHPEDEEEIANIDLDAAILRYSEAGNFTLAVRYMYLKLIRAAFEKNAVLIKGSSTNAEIAKAFQDPQQSRDFRFLASAYEYIFYGGFVPDADQFELLKKKFHSFEQIPGI